MRTGMTELEVRVAMLVYAARKLLDVSGGGMGMGAPAWLWAAVDIAFRETYSRLATRLQMAVKKPRGAEDKRRCNATLLESRRRA